MSRSHLSLSSLAWVITLGLPVVSAAQPGPPKPAAELTALVAATPPSLKCTGTTVMPNGMSFPMTATITTRAELGGFWMHESIAGNITNLGTFTLEVYTTFDPTTKQYYRTMLDSLGDYISGGGTGSATKLDFQMTGSGTFGAFKFRDHASADAKAIKRSGERTMDSKTWTKDYELTCTKS